MNGKSLLKELSFWSLAGLAETLSLEEPVACSFMAKSTLNLFSGYLLKLKNCLIVKFGILDDKHSLFFGFVWLLKSLGCKFKLLIMLL